MLLQSFSAGASRKGWPTFFPAVSHEAKSRISQRLFRGSGEQNGLPALVLFNIEWSLLQALSRRLRKTDWIIRGRDGCKVQASQGRQNCRGFQEVSATHGGHIPFCDWSTAIYRLNGCFRGAHSL